MDFCTCCKAAIDPLEISVKCTVCTKVFKPRCVDLSYTEAYKVSRNNGLSWTCRDCFKISNDTKILKQEILYLQGELKTALDHITRQRLLQYCPGNYKKENFGADGEFSGYQYAGRNAFTQANAAISLFEEVESDSDDNFDRRNPGWQCMRCEIWNYTREQVCYACHESIHKPRSVMTTTTTTNKRLPKTTRTKANPPWVNEMISLANARRESRPITGASSQPVEIIELSDSSDDDFGDPKKLMWECIYCKDLNYIRDGFCYTCKAPHQKEAASKSIHKWQVNVREAEARQQDGEWECGLCTFKNPSTGKICLLCEGDKTEQNDIPIRSSTPEVERLHFKLLNLDDNDLIANTEAFECAICLLEIQPGQGVTLKNCLHQFCKQCLADTVEHSTEAEVRCPYRDDQYSCDFPLRDREIKALVKPEIYDQHLARSVKEAENKTENSFHCKTPDCRGWCVYEDDVNSFRCPVCLKENCLTCRAIHEGVNCKQYQDKVKADAERDENAKKTEEAIKELIKRGEAMHCPGCKVVIMRKFGCDWLQCTACKMEICWVTKGPRWGPRGKHDTSGGCKCGVNGRRCHPQCNYCH